MKQFLFCALIALFCASCGSSHQTYTVKLQNNAVVTVEDYGNHNFNIGDTVCIVGNDKSPGWSIDNGGWMENDDAIHSLPNSEVTIIHRIGIVRTVPKD